MTMRRALRQMSAEAERSEKGRSEALSDPGSDEALRPRHEPEDTGPGLLTAVLARENMQQAWKRVRAQQGRGWNRWSWDRRGGRASDVGVACDP